MVDGLRAARYGAITSRERAMPTCGDGHKHAALWLIGPDMPGLLRLGSQYVADRGGNIDKDIADKFGEKAVVFMSITAAPADIARMERDKESLKRTTGCGVVFQPMDEPTVPEGFQAELFGFDVVSEDAPGLIAEITRLLDDSGILLLAHTGEQRVVPGPRRKTQAGQKYVVMLPHGFDYGTFNYQLTEVLKKYHGLLKSPVRHVPGLLWWW